MNVEGPFYRLFCKLQANLSEFCLLTTMRIKYIYLPLRSSKAAVPRLSFTIYTFENNNLHVYV